MTLYKTIVSDPPWSWRDKGSRLSPDRSDDPGKAHYDTLAIPEIANIGGTFVRKLSATDALLFLWAPHAFVIDGTAALVARAYGFEAKQEGIWVKTTNDGQNVRFGGGHYLRLCSEPFLVCAKGKAASLIKDHGTANVLFAPRTKHSAKPESFYDLVERIAPGPYLELYARRQRPGWTCWGDQCPTGGA